MAQHTRDELRFLEVTHHACDELRLDTRWAHWVALHARKFVSRTSLVPLEAVSEVGGARLTALGDQLH